MRGDLPEWALRLSSELPSRRHEARSNYGTETRGGDSTGIRFIGKGERSRKAINPGSGRGGKNALQVVVRGVTYPSIGAARKALACSNTTIYAMLSDGRAKYVSNTHQSMVGIAKGRSK